MMIFSGYRQAVFGVSTSLFLGALGCAHTPLDLPPPSAEVRSSLGCVGVRWNGPSPWLSNFKPARGFQEGAERGAKAVVELWVRGQRDPRDIISVPFMYLTSPIPALIGGIAGGFIAPAAEEVEAAGVALDRSLENATYGEILTDRISQLAQAQTAHRFYRLPSPDPASHDSALTDRSLGFDCLNTILEIGDLRLALQEGPNAGDINPSLTMVASLRSRLVRAADGAELHEYLKEYRGGTHSFTRWGADDAQAFREELDRAIESLAMVVVNHLFLADSPPKAITTSP